MFSVYFSDSSKNGLSDVSCPYSRPATNFTNTYWRFVGKPVVRCGLVYLIVRVNISTETKARINVTENKCGVSFGCHVPHKDSIAEHFFQFHDLCSTVWEILLSYVDANVAAQDQYAISCDREDGDWSRSNAISEP